MAHCDDEDEVCISIRLSRETADRLLRLADVCHSDPRGVAASLLHDILKDDEFYNEPVIRNDRMLN